MLLLILFAISLLPTFIYHLDMRVTVSSFINSDKNRNRNGIKDDSDSAADGIKRMLQYDEDVSEEAKQY